MNRKSIRQKFSLLTAVLGFSLFLGSLALATPGELQGSDDGNWALINDEGIIDAPLAIVVDHFKDVHKAEPMIPGLKLKRILEQISDSERIDYDQFEVPWPLKERYTIYRAREKYVSEKEILLTLTPLDDYPFEDKNKVPARIKKSSFLLQSLPEDESKTRVTIQLAVDPGGYLPVWLVNLVSKSWSKDLFQNLRKNTRREIARQKFSRTNLARKANADPASSF